MRIHEVIYFTHELDLLEAHLEEHQYFVDKFFIKESPVLWTGVTKPLVFTQNQDRYARFNVEVMVIPPEEFDLTIPSAVPDEDYKKWFDVRRNNRSQSRRYKWKEIQKGADYVLSMDADEIIDSKRSHLLTDLMTGGKLEHIGLILSQAYFWVDTVGTEVEVWRGFRRDVPHRFRMSGHPREKTQLIGWHFSNCYKSPENIRTKFLGGTTHYGYKGTDNVPLVGYIEQCLEQRLYPNKRLDLEESHMPEKPQLRVATDLPKFIIENPNRFPWFVK